MGRESGRRSTHLGALRRDTEPCVDIVRTAWDVPRRAAGRRCPLSLPLRQLFVTSFSPETLSELLVSLEVNVAHVVAAQVAEEEPAFVLGDCADRGHAVAVQIIERM